MANGNIRGITVEFGGDTTKLGKALDTIYKDGKKVDKALSDVNKSLKFEPKNTELLSQKQALLAKKIDQTKKRLDALKQAQATLDASGVDKSSDEYMKLRRQIMQAEGQLGAYEAQLRRVESTQRGQQSTMEKLEGTISDQEQELKALKDEYKNYVIEGKESSEAAKTLESRIQQLSGELADNKKSMNKAEKAVDKLDKSIDSAGDSAKKAKDGFTVMKGALANLVSDGVRRAADGVIDFGKSVLDTGMEFDAQMSKVAALSGETGYELEKLRDTAKEMGATTQYTATEAGQGLEYMALAGWKSEQMVKGLPAVLNLAAAASMDLGTASDIVTDDLTAFGMAADDAAHFSDVLAATSTNSNTDVEQMGEAFKYAASTAGALGYSVEDTSVAVGLMANAGIKGSQAGTSLRTALSNMASPTDAMATAMDELGISLTDSEGNMLSLQGVMGELRGAIGNVDVALTDSEGNAREYNDIIADMKKNGADLSQIQKVQAASTIFGKNAMAGMLAIIQASPDDYEKLTDAIYNCDGAASRMADTVNDNLKGDLIKMDSALDGLKLSLEEKLDEPLRDAVQNVTKSLSGSKMKSAVNSLGDTISKALSKIDFDAVITNVENFFKTVSNLAKAITPIVSGVWSAVSKVINLFSDHLDALTGGMIAFGSALGALKLAQFVTGIASMVQGVVAAEGAVAALTAATGPIGLIAAVAGAAVAFGTLALESSNSSESISENIEKTKELCDECDELHDSIEEAGKASEERVAAVEQDTAVAERYADKLDELAKKENKSADEKKRMKYYVDKLNELLPNLNIQYDEEKDKLSKSTDEIYKNIEARKAQAKAAAYKTNYEEAVAEEVKLQDKREELMAQKLENQNAIRVADSNYKNAIAKRDRTGLDFGEVANAKKDLEDAQKTFSDTVNELNKLDDALDKNKEKQEKWSDALDTQALEESIADLQEIGKDAGISIPKTVLDGMQSGKYAVADGVDQLKRLIDFDDAIQKAGVQGIELPEGLSESVSNGKTSVEDAVNRLKEALTFDNSEEVANAKKNGVEIPEGYRDGILSGKYTAEEACGLLAKDTCKALEPGGKAAKPGKMTDDEYAQAMLRHKTNVNSAAKSVGETAKGGFESIKMKSSGEKAMTEIAKGAKSNSGSVKKSVVNPFESAKTAINKIISQIKQWFSNLKLKIPSISVPNLPKFSIKTKHFSKGPFDFNYPAGLDVSWHKDGGIFTSPTLLHGVGEAGAEAVLPLDMLWKKFDDMADSIVSGMATVMRSYSSGGNGGDIHLDVYLYPNGPKMGEQIVRAYDTYKTRLG